MDDNFKLVSRWESSKEVKAFWNMRAKSYNEQNSQSIGYKEELIRGYVENGVLTKESIVLDLGCGPGNYTRLIAPYVKEVIGVDISDEMLKFAKENNKEFDNVSFRNVDWWTADVEKLGFKNRFDLVFANMTPSVRDEETFLKLVECSKSYCHFATFIYRRSRLGEAFGKQKDFNSNFKNVFDKLWEMKMYPQISYRVGVSVREFTPEEALNVVNVDFDGNIDGNPNVIFKDLIKGGKVQDEFKFRSAVMLWSVLGD